MKRTGGIFYTQVTLLSSSVTYSETLSIKYLKFLRSILSYEKIFHRERGRGEEIRGTDLTSTISTSRSSVELWYSVRTLPFDV